MSRLNEKFLAFKNEKNNCWLDACLSIIVYNRTLKKIVNGFPKSQINYIIAKHEEAATILNGSDKNIEDRINATKAMLVKIQQSTLQYLQHVSNFKEGEPDSAFCALYNLILQDKSNIKEQVIINWSWSKKCANCGNSSKYEPLMKPIITLPKVKSFNPVCPTSFYTCSSCKTEQEMTLTYKLLPPCLIFHFEKGAGDENNYPLNFTVDKREYHLTAVVVLKKRSDCNLNHFVTYIREPSLNFWLDCDDLNTNIVTFSYIKPEFALKNVYMYVFEAFDDLGKITNQVSVSTDQSVENLHVEIIDLTNEVEEIKQPFENINNDTSKLFQSEKIISLLTSEEKLDVCPIKSESKAENKAVGIVDQPLRKVIKETKINVNNCMAPIIRKESDTPDINSNMTPIHGTFLVKKECKERSYNLFGDKNINTYDESRNKEENVLQSLIGTSANKSSSKSFEKKNISLEADYHVIPAKPTNEQNFKPVNPTARRFKSDQYLSADALEFIKAKKKESLEEAALSSVGSIKNEYVHGEIKQSSSKVGMCNEESADKHSNMLSERSDACEYDVKELMLKLQQIPLKVKKIKDTTWSSNTNEIAGTSKGAISDGLPEANDAMKSAVRKSSRISSKCKKIEQNKKDEPEVVLLPCPHGRLKSVCTDRVMCTKMQMDLNNVVERTFATFTKEMFFMQDKPK